MELTKSEKLLADLKRAAQVGLIDDPQVWFRFLEARNMIAHVYKEKLADEVYEQAKEFPEVVEELIRKAEEELKDERER